MPRRCAGARLVLAGDASARAPMTASWLSQMGWEMVVVDDLIEWSQDNGRSVAGPYPSPPIPSHRTCRASTSPPWPPLTDPLIVDLAASRAYAGGPHSCGPLGHA